jgi:hypothetical protein
MKRWIALGLGLAVALLVAIALRGGRDPRAPAAAPEGAQPAEARRPASPPRGADAVLRQEEVAELPPEMRRYQELRAFQEEARAFFAQQDELSEVEREARAAALREQVVAKQREGLLVPGEALLLELGLLKATLDDPAVYEHEARALIEKHEQEVERRREEAASRPDPRFDAYKRREAEVVREVMALEEIPEGRSRADYLRERLQRLRSEIYGDGAGEADPARPYP